MAELMNLTFTESPPCSLTVFRWKAAQLLCEFPRLTLGIVPGQVLVTRNSPRFSSCSQQLSVVHPHPCLSPLSN